MKTKTFIQRAASLVTACLLAGAGAGARGESGTKESRVGFHLDTVITLTAYVSDAAVLDEAMAECARLEEILSRTVEGSDVWRINHAEGVPVTVSEETAEVLACAAQVSELSGGAFDVTIAPCALLWDFLSAEPALPDAEALAAAAALTDWRQMRLEGCEVTLPAGRMIDLGGIAKGYIADRVKAFLMERGVESAILSFGGNIVAIGMKPGGKEWKVGIQDIDKPTGEYMMVVRNLGGSTVTSGIYERGFDLGGVRYHHILEAATGWPVQNTLASVTILSDSSMMGDALATAAFALGEEEGKALIESLPGTEAIFIRKDRTAVLTDGADAWVVQ